MSSYTEQLAGKRFELLEDSFLFQWQSKEYDIDLPGEFTGYSGLPVTVKDFLQYPDSWERTENYISRFGKETLGREHVIGVLTKGTVMRFVKIHKTSNIYETHYWVIIEIENGPFKGFISELSLIRIRPTNQKPIISPFLKEIE